MSINPTNLSPLIKGPSMDEILSGMGSPQATNLQAPNASYQSLMGAAPQGGMVENLVLSVLEMLSNVVQSLVSIVVSIMSGGGHSGSQDAIANPTGTGVPGAGSDLKASEGAKGTGSVFGQILDCASGIFGKKDGEKESGFSPGGIFDWASRTFGGGKGGGFLDKVG